MDVSRKLKTVITAGNLRYEDVAVHLGVTRQTIWNWLRGRGPTRFIAQPVDRFLAAAEKALTAGALVVDADTADKRRGQLAKIIKRFSR